MIKVVIHVVNKRKPSEKVIFLFLDCKTFVFVMFSNIENHLVNFIELNE